MTTYASAAAQPAALLIAHTRQLLSSRTNRGTVNRWLHSLESDTVETLISPDSNSPTAPATRLLLAEHRSGTKLATAVLLARKARWIATLSQLAIGDTPEERFQNAVETFLSVAAKTVPLNHRFLDEQLYWITLRSLNLARHAHTAEPSALSLTIDLADDSEIYMIDNYLTVSSILGWARAVDAISDRDLHVLTLRFGSDSTVSVRQIAAQIGDTEDSIESRLRRSMQRIRTAVQARGAEFERACATAVSMPAGISRKRSAEEVAA